MMNTLKWFVFAATLLSSHTFAQSIQLKQVYALDTKTAQLLMQAAQQQCQKINQNIAVVVVDQGGNPLVAQRHESVGPHNLAAAEKKAYSALSTKTPTLILSQNAHENSDAKNLTTVSSLLLLGGGAPIFYQKQLVGAIGVAGAGGAKNDHLCAVSAIEAVVK